MKKLVFLFVAFVLYLSHLAVTKQLTMNQR